MIAESYVKSRDTGLTIMPKFYPNFLKDRPELVFYSLQTFKSPFPSINRIEENDEIKNDSMQPRL